MSREEHGQVGDEAPWRTFAIDYLDTVGRIDDDTAEAVHNLLTERGYDVLGATDGPHGEDA